VPGSYPGYLYLSFISVAGFCTKRPKSSDGRTVVPSETIHILQITILGVPFAMVVQVLIFFKGEV
jgi:hypothetical protein